MKTPEKTFTCFIAIDKWNGDRFSELSLNNLPIRFKKLDAYNISYFFGRITDEPRDPGQPSATNLVVSLDEIGEEEIYYQRIENDLFTGNLSICRQASTGFENRFENMVKIGHRGCGKNCFSGGIPENTINSFLGAQKRGAHAIELDVHLTLDNILVISHDETISGMDISTKTYQELSAALFEQGGDLLSLEDALHALPDDIGINIETKVPETPLLNFSRYLGRITIEVLITAKKHPNKKILFSSFSLTNCIYLKMLNSSCKVCFLVNSKTFSPERYERVIGPNGAGYTAQVGQQAETLENQEPSVPVKALLEINEFLVALCGDVGIDGFVVGSGVLTVNPELIERAKKAGMELYCYGELANDYQESMDLLELGFSGVISDDLFEIDSITRHSQ